MNLHTNINFFDIPIDVRKIIWEKVRKFRYKCIYDKVLNQMYYEYFLITKSGNLTWDTYYTEMLKNKNVIHCGAMIFRDLKKVSKYNNKLTEIYMRKCTAYDTELSFDWLSQICNSYNLIYDF